MVIIYYFQKRNLKIKCYNIKNIYYYMKIYNILKNEKKLSVSKILDHLSSQLFILMFSLLLYFLISTSLLFSTIVKEYISNYDVYETISFVYSNKFSLILLANFTFTLSLLIIKYAFEFFFGHLILAQWQEILNNMNCIYIDSIFIIPALLFNHQNGSMDSFVILIPILFRFLIFLIKSINNGLNISQDSFQSKFHTKIFVVQFALLFSTFQCFCSFLSYFRIIMNPLSCLVSEQCLICFIYELSDTIKHIIFIYDINNPGLFKVETIIRYNFLCNLIFEFMVIMVEVIIELYSSTFGLSFYVLRPKTIDMLTFSTHLHKYQNWLSLSKMLNDEIPDATEEDLLHEDQCIICRLKMKVKNVNGVKKCDAKRLPCGHCYHLACLQQWIQQQMKCPLCQYDLKQLIMPNNEETEGENDDNFNDFFEFFENLNGRENIQHHDVQNDNENRDGNENAGWKFTDFLNWILPAKDVNQNDQELMIHHHHHHRHRHHGSNNINENDHKHIHKRRHRKSKKSNNSYDLKKTKSIDDVSSLIGLTYSDIFKLTDNDFLDQDNENSTKEEKKN